MAKWKANPEDYVRVTVQNRKFIVLYDDKGPRYVKERVMYNQHLQEYLRGWCDRTRWAREHNKWPESGIYKEVLGEAQKLRKPSLDKTVRV